MPDQNDEKWMAARRQTLIERGEIEGRDRDDFQ